KQLFKQELAWMREGVRARGTKQKARIERFEKLKGQISQTSSNFNLDIDLASSRLGKQVFELYDASYAIDHKVILKDFNYIVQTNDRIINTYENGTSKSNFINLIARKRDLDSVELVVGDTVRISYFQQDNIDIPENKRVINYLQEIADEVSKKDGS